MMQRAQRFQFSGEESARFTRFAAVALDTGLKLRIEVEGREPLTSRPIQFSGHVIDRKFDGYMRLVVVKEAASGVVYWVAGSNATKSIAAKTVTYVMEDAEVSQLVASAQAAETYLPTLEATYIGFPRELGRIDEALRNRTREQLDFLLGCLASQAVEVKRECALAIRAFASVVTESVSLQRQTEERVLQALVTCDDLDTRIALVEDLGYFGTARSREFLKSLIAGLAEPDHVLWAAVIALGRLPGEDVLAGLTGALSSRFGWAVAAALLGLARRATPAIRDKIEPIFVEFLHADKDELHRRYACLGLSHCGGLSQPTITRLCEIASSDMEKVPLRGYAALALSASFESVSSDQRKVLRGTMSRLSKATLSDLDEPDDVWSLEFLAELASLLEANEEAAIFHAALSQVFTDWRSSYYRALSHYESAESAVLKGQVEAGVESLETALRSLPHSDDLPQDARTSIAFRRDIIESRLRIATLLSDWQAAIQADKLMSIALDLRQVAAVYARYDSVGAAAHSKQLSPRELAYLRNTRILLETLSSVAELDGEVRSKSANVDTIFRLLDTIVDSFQINPQIFQDNSARSLGIAANSLTKNLRTLQQSLSIDGVQTHTKLKRLRDALTEIRRIFSKTTWPMPARACPVAGLGRGKITVIREQLEGDGTEANPLIYPYGTTVVLQIRAEIDEMTPGGTTRAIIVLRGGEQRIEESLPIVEGPYSCTFHVRGPLSPVIPSKYEAKLIFQSRDCIQESVSAVFFIKQGKRLGE